MAEKKKKPAPSLRAGLLALPTENLPPVQRGLLAYEPSLREKIAYALADGWGLLGGDIQGQRGIIGKTKQAIDFVPGVGDAVGFNEAGRDIQAGNYGAGAAGLGLATLGLIPGAGDLAAKGGKKLLKETVQEAPKGIRAFHGSPHSFDKFSMDKIGTGEGAQAYGHGLYFAENESVAKGYRDALTGNHSGSNFVTKLRGEELSNPSDVQKAIAQRHRGDPSGYIAETESRLSRAKQKLASASKSDDLGLGISEYDIQAMEIDALQKDIDEARTYSVGDLRQSSPGSMYEVNIRANPDDFLDWDKPLSEQPQNVRDAVNRVGRSPNTYGLDRVSDDMRGIEMKRLLNDPQGAEALKQAGIPGIKYLDAGSRGAGDGSRNYVVFDEKLIDIVRKYGLATAIASGVITREMGAQMQAQGDI